MSERIPLFVTRFSLSSKSAIGVQTRRLLAACAPARHFYWETRDLTRQPPFSRRLEYLPVARMSMFKHLGRARRWVDQLGLTRWPQGRLDRATGRRVRALRPATSAVYVAPIGGEDAHRMRQIVHRLGRPFVVHLWDLLDGGPETNADLAWLLANASAVFGLTETMLEASGRGDAILLRFSRGPSRHVARPPPPHGPLRVIALGDVLAYREGFSQLQVVSDRLRDRGIGLELVYVGPWEVPRSICPSLNTVGFITGEDARDAALAGCHVGFLPGPLAAPDVDLRSRYSIPSRILDYMAVGLPIVGLVHPASATATFARRFGVDAGLTVDAVELAEKIGALRDPDTWRRQSETVRTGALASEAGHPEAVLVDALGKLAGEPDPGWAAP